MKSRMVLLTIFVLMCRAMGTAQEPSLAPFAQELEGTDLTIDMVAIPSGDFLMGSPSAEAKRNTDEGPVHKVHLDAFWISKYEVTWELYNLFVNRSLDTVVQKTQKVAQDSGSDAMSGATDAYSGATVQKGKEEEMDVKIDAIAGATVPYVDMSLGMGTDPGLPVGNVTQRAASTFCEWLSAITGHFYRLPTEAEWEYAARAGTRTAYFFGDDPKKLDAYAWYYDNSNGTYHKVGQKKPNPWGLYDIYGNVAEWTLDQYDAQTYEKSAEVTENPLVTAYGEYPITVRGGSYYDDALLARSAARRASNENWKMRDPQFPKSKWWNTDAPFVGFRVVRHKTAPTPAEIKKYWIHKEND